MEKRGASELRQVLLEEASEFAEGRNSGELYDSAEFSSWFLNHMEFRDLWVWTLDCYGVEDPLLLTPDGAVDAYLKSKFPPPPTQSPRTIVAQMPPPTFVPSPQPIVARGQKTASGSLWAAVRKHPFVKAVGIALTVVLVLLYYAAEGASQLGFFNQRTWNGVGLCKLVDTSTKSESHEGQVVTFGSRSSLAEVDACFKKEWTAEGLDYVDTSYNSDIGVPMTINRWRTKTGTMYSYGYFNYQNVNYIMLAKR